MINIITNVLSSFVKSQECKSNVLHMPAKLSMVNCAMNRISLIVQGNTDAHLYKVLEID